MPCNFDVMNHYKPMPLSKQNEEAFHRAQENFERAKKELADYTAESKTRCFEVVSEIISKFSKHRAYNMLFWDKGSLTQNTPLKILLDKTFKYSHQDVPSPAEIIRLFQECCDKYTHCLAPYGSGLPSDVIGDIHRAAGELEFGFATPRVTLHLMQHKLDELTDAQETAKIHMLSALPKKQLAQNCLKALKHALAQLRDFSKTEKIIGIPTLCTGLLEYEEELDLTVFNSKLDSSNTLKNTDIPVILTLLQQLRNLITRYQGDKIAINALPEEKAVLELTVKPNLVTPPSSNFALKCLLAISAVSLSLALMMGLSMAFIGASTGLVVGTIALSAIGLGAGLFHKKYKPMDVPFGPELRPL